MEANKNIKWIFVGGMIRSGSTLQYQVVRSLVENELKGTALGFVESDELDHFLGQCEGDPTTQYPCVIKTHVCTAGIRQRLEQGDALAFYTYRDIRDVVISGGRNFSIPIDDFISGRYIDEAICESYLWSSYPSVHISAFEEFMGDLAGWIAGMGEVLGCDLKPEKVNELVDEFSLERQQARIKAAAFTDVAGFSVDPATLLHKNHIDRAAIEGWRGVLTPSQIREIEVRAADWMDERGYQFETFPEGITMHDIVRSLRVRTAVYLQASVIELGLYKKKLDELERLQALAIESEVTHVEEEKPHGDFSLPENGFKQFWRRFFT